MDCLLSKGVWDLEEEVVVVVIVVEEEDNGDGDDDDDDLPRSQPRNLECFEVVEEVVIVAGSAFLCFC